MNNRISNTPISGASQIEFFSRENVNSAQSTNSSNATRPPDNLGAARVEKRKLSTAFRAATSNLGRRHLANLNNFQNLSILKKFKKIDRTVNSKVSYDNNHKKRIDTLKRQASDIDTSQKLRVRMADLYSVFGHDNVFQVLEVHFQFVPDKNFEKNDLKTRSEFYESKAIAMCQKGRKLDRAPAFFKLLIEELESKTPH